MDLLELIISKPILALVLSWITYSLFVIRQNRKLRKDLEQREIINEINDEQKKNDDLNLVDLVRLRNEQRERDKARRDSEKR